jgi:DNA-binding transcriptional MerR regulator
MPRPQLKHRDKMTSRQVAKKLGLTLFQLNYRITQGIFPEPTVTTRYGVRYFDQAWLDNVLNERS